MIEIFWNILSSISLVLLIAYLLTRLDTVQRFISTERPGVGVRLALAVVFGLIGILSTYTGISVQGAIANTRVIAVMAGGILGGPLVGVGAGVIAGVHRLAIDLGGFTAVACTVSTILEGVIAGAFSNYLKRNRNNGALVFSITFLAELVQMGIILLLARPFDRAWELVKLISIPMTFLNSIGVAFFVKIFDSVFLEQDRAAGDRVRLALEIAEQCLPYLRRGLNNGEGMRSAAELIQRRSAAAGVMITNDAAVLAVSGELPSPDGQALPDVVAKTLSASAPRSETEAPEGDPLFGRLDSRVALCAPLTSPDGRVIGTLTVLVPRYRKTLQAETGFVSGLAGLFSTQLALAQMEYQKKLLEKAEYAALQSQINPHFFFNALSTITAFCREKPERARELLIVLASYFRSTLQSSDDQIPLRRELEHVNCYLELEKARFEEKLQIQIDIPEELQSLVIPSFILQPLVENAVKHGAMHSGRPVGLVRVRARRLGGVTCIAIEDNGQGISPEIVRQLYAGTLRSGFVGLSNVHKRLVSLYGPKYGLRIHRSPRGTRVVVPIPAQSCDRGEASGL